MRHWERHWVLSHRGEIETAGEVAANIAEHT